MCVHCQIVEMPQLNRLIVIVNFCRLPAVPVNRVCLSSGHRTATIGCFVASHLSLALLIMEASDLSEAFGPVPPANQSTQSRNPSTAKMPPSSPVDGYNSTTTRKPVICQFRKNGLLVGALVAVAYKKMKIWQRIQWPFLLVAHWQLPVRFLSNTLSLGIRLFCSGPIYA